MELKQRKRIDNFKYDTGKIPGQSPLQSPLYWGFPGLSDEMPTTTWLDNPVNQTAIGNLSDYDPNVLKQAVTGTSGLGSYESVFGKTGTGSDNANKGSLKGQKAASVVGGIVNLAQGYLGQQSAVKSTEELMANAGTQNRSIGGVGYIRQNYANDSEVLSNLDKSGLSSTLGNVASGASAGAAFGPIGAGVGALVGGITGLLGWSTSKSAQRKRLNNARQLTSRINIGNQAGAMTTALQQDYYSQYSNTNGGVLYANKGKDIGII